MKPVRNHTRGFTLIEIIVATTLASVLTLIFTNFVSKGIQLYRLNNAQVNLLERVERVMREFEQSTRAANKIVSARSNELIYERYYKIDAAAEPCPTQVRYFVSGDQFMVGETVLTLDGSSCVPGSAAESVELVIDYLAETVNLFTYFNESSGALAARVDGTFVVGEIKMVGLSIALDKNRLVIPQPVSAGTKVNLRNLKKNL